MPEGPIDFHAHLPASGFLGTLSPFVPQMKRYFHTDIEEKSLKEVLKEFDDGGVSKIVVLPVDASKVSGIAGDTNNFMARVQSEHPERFICFATVDPKGGEMSVNELRRAVKDLGLQGLKLHPQLQSFRPDDPKVFPVYEEAEKLGIPVVIHTGMVGIGAGMPGGGGLRLDYSRPIYVDEVAVNFQELNIVMCHFGWPWTEEALAIALHKENVYLDLSGWAPKHIPDIVFRYMNGLLPDKFLFGTDYPLISPSRWMSEFEQVPLKPDVRENVLRLNALRVLSGRST